MDQESNVTERDAVVSRDTWEAPAFEDIGTSAEASAYMGTLEERD
ncbi:MAG: pyrroloquinoline quinone precursor peptide PqqA [Streptosporangiales bacterium]|nr:pyrroloquinoline quinone precursor peptide PqqA [Streptosporangiales bacterium]MBO0889609.1 pyrroloquinoline quinone precursor peptide PqqA [Acidothermales bacterium]